MSERNSSLTNKFKQAFHMGGSRKRDGTDDVRPLESGTYGQGTTPRETENMPSRDTMPSHDTMPAATEAKDATPAADGVTNGHRSVGTAIKEAFTSAPWEAHHDRTLEALTHAKAAHIKATQAQASLRAAAEAEQKAELAQRHMAELEREQETHRNNLDGLANKKKDWENSKLALAEHQKNHDHHSRLLREAEEAAAAREAEAGRLAPLHEEHMKGLGPLQDEANAAQRERANAEQRREDLLRQLRELETALGPMRTREEEATRKLDEHHRLGDGHKQKATAAAEEAAALRQRANEHRNNLEPHARNLKTAQGLVGVKENDYNKAREAADLAKQRLEQMRQQHDQLAREAREAAQVAQKHADAFEKLKREAEAEDAKKAELWNEARKTGHIEDDNSSKQELHKLADRFHTVLRSPIDTTSLAGQDTTAHIRDIAAKISGSEPKTGAEDGLGSDGRTAMTEDRGLERGEDRGIGKDTLNGNDAPASTIRPKSGPVTTPPYSSTAAREE